MYNKEAARINEIIIEPTFFTFRERSSNMSACLGGGLSQNADTADAGEGGGGSLIKC